MASASETGEDSLISQLLALLPAAPADLIAGPGDDCAVVAFSDSEWQLLKTDAIVEHVHFLSDENMERVGWKAIARVVSDFAAMGGAPRWFLVTLGIPPEYEIAKLQAFYRGMARCLSTYDSALTGGETTRVAHGSNLVISIAATGVVEKSQLILRSTAQLGDAIYVTGRLGGSLAGRHLDITPRLPEGQWLAQHGFARAMMDLSDGLAKDLPRLAAASQLGFLLDETRLPLHKGCTTAQALTDGEDYELLFTVSAEKSAQLETQWRERFPDLALTNIGRMVARGEGMTLHGGWDHFPTT